ncbi:MAG: hypothetical protein ACOYLE_08200 [Bacteroidales bacterium]
MAKPIKETPIIFGDDAKKFLKEKKSAEERGPNLAERKRIEDTYQNFKKLCPSFGF